MLIRYEALLLRRETDRTGLMVASKPALRAVEGVPAIGDREEGFGMKGVAKKSKHRAPSACITDSRLTCGVTISRPSV